MATPKLMSGSAEKAAGDSIRLPCDFGNEPRIIAGGRITLFTVTCSGVGAPTVSGERLDYYYQLSAKFTGGTAGTYEVVYTITLDDEDASVISRTGVLRVY